MSKINTSEELMKFILNMNEENSVLQFTIPGKGKFALVLQEERPSIQADVKVNPKLGQMIQESQKEYEQGKAITTSDLLKSISVEDFKQ